MLINSKVSLVLLLIPAHTCLAHATAKDELMKLANGGNSYSVMFDNIVMAPVADTQQEKSIQQPTNTAALKQSMLVNLDAISESIAARYAPFSWKESHLKQGQNGSGANWSFAAEVNQIKTRINNGEISDVLSYRKAVNSLFTSLRDYHASIGFYSTEKSALPIMISVYGDKYFISAINQKAIPAGAAVPKVGDEVVSFGGLPIKQAMLATQNKYVNLAQTDNSLAAVRLTNRTSLSAQVPQGQIAIGVKSGADIKTYNLEWKYTPEQIAPQPFIRDSQNKSMDMKRKLPMEWLNNMRADILDKTETGQEVASSYDTEDKDGFLPDFGKIIQQPAAGSPFRNYIYRSDLNSSSIGYIRINTYSVEDCDIAVQKLAAIIKDYQQKTDALVIDQLHNPGGNLWYLYAIASMLTDKPLKIPLHRVALTPKDVNDSVVFLTYADLIQTDADAQEFMGKTLSGYPVTVDTVKKRAEFHKQIVKQWNESGTSENKLLTSPLPLYGLGEITPSSKANYTKPILILTDSLDFSGGDFFPAIMQDNGRAKTFGERTAGAGGIVKSYDFSNNLLGLSKYNLTATMAIRQNGQPLENLGVTPDIPYTLTLADLQNNYSEYIKAVNTALQQMIPVKTGKAVAKNGLGPRQEKKRK